MSFNPDPSKQAQEAFFPHKIKKPSHWVLIFNNDLVIYTNSKPKIPLFVLRWEIKVWWAFKVYILQTESINSLGYYINLKNVYQENH